MFTDDNQIANGICPSPTGEARWGLMTIGGVILIIYCAAGLSWFLSERHQGGYPGFLSYIKVVTP